MLALWTGLVACGAQLGTTSPQDRERAEFLASEPAFEVTHDGFEAGPIVTTAYRGGGTNNQSTRAGRVWRAIDQTATAESERLFDEIGAALLASGWSELEPAGPVRSFQQSYSGVPTGAFSAQALLGFGADNKVILSLSAPGYSVG